MAQVTRREKKDGTVSYTIRVYSGRTQSDKVITRCKTVVPPPGMSGKKVEKWVQEQAMLFEQQVTNGMALDSNRTRRSSTGSAASFLNKEGG